MERATTHLELTIDVDSDPITGSVSNGAHRSRPFNGWIELVGAIEAARSPVTAQGEAHGKTLGSHPGANPVEL
ncbi:MAG: hypothetical protein JO027_08675 [Solirubrobacterales bacterium]|nr:hypothetical protein [Solirubrobacterales bacterium]